MSGFARWAGQRAMPSGLWLSRAEWASLPPATRATMLGLASWCVLVSAVVLSAIGAIQFAASGGATPSTLAVQGAPKSRAAAAGDAILERPLFVRSRQAAVTAPPQRPLPPPPPPPPRVMSDAGVTLSGVFINGATAKAFLKTSQNPAGIWLAPDEVAGGWRLVAVRPGEVELEGSSGRILLPFAAGAGRK